MLTRSARIRVAKVISLSDLALSKRLVRDDPEPVRHVPSSPSPRSRSRSRVRSSDSLALVPYPPVGVMPEKGGFTAPFTDVAHRLSDLRQQRDSWFAWISFRSVCVSVLVLLFAVAAVHAAFRVYHVNRDCITNIDHSTQAYDIVLNSCAQLDVLVRTKGIPISERDAKHCRETQIEATKSAATRLLMCREAKFSDFIGWLLAHIPFLGVFFRTDASWMEIGSALSLISGVGLPALKFLYGHFRSAQGAALFHQKAASD